MNQEYANPPFAFLCWSLLFGLGLTHSCSRSSKAPACYLPERFYTAADPTFPARSRPEGRDWVSMVLAGCYLPTEGPGVPRIANCS